MIIRGVKFTCADFQKIEVALNLRVESCVENLEVREAEAWLRVLDKVRKLKTNNQEKNK